MASRLHVAHHGRAVPDLRRWAAAMRSIIVLLALLCCGCRAKRTVQCDGYVSAWPGTNLPITAVNYGFSDDRVHFAVFQTSAKQITPGLHLTYFNNSRGQKLCRGFVILPDGMQQDLPTSDRIFEFTYGQFKVSDISFSKRQLVAYLDTSPRPPTIDGLSQFIRTKE